MLLQQTNRKRFWVLFVVSFVFSLSAVLIPFLFIEPFRAQTPGRVAVAFWLRRWGPALTLVLFLIALGAHWRLWNGSRFWKKFVSSIMLFIMVCIVWFSQQNYFEWIFNPLPNPAYVSGLKVDFLEDQDMVLAVNINGDRVAYPVRFLAYHHLVEDMVAGEPVVATY